MKRFRWQGEQLAIMATRDAEPAPPQKKKEDEPEHIESETLALKRMNRDNRAFWEKELHNENRRGTIGRS